MNKQIKAALVGIGSGSKTHLTYAIIEGDKVWIKPSGCGSSKTSGLTRSTSYGLKLSEEAFEISSDAYENFRIGENCQRVFDAELIATENACSKCLSVSKFYLAKKVVA
jgi:hypothetical protein